MLLDLTSIYEKYPGIEIRFTGFTPDEIKNDPKMRMTMITFKIELGGGLSILPESTLSKSFDGDGNPHYAGCTPIIQSTDPVFLIDKIVQETFEKIKNMSFMKEI